MLFVYFVVPTSESFRLSDNLLTGPIPSSLGNLTNLQTMVLEKNRLNGTIPTRQRPAVIDRWELLLPPLQLAAVDRSEYFT